MTEAPVLPLGDIAFYWRMLDRYPSDADGTPAFLPFDFSVDAALGLVIQRRNPLVLDWLKRVYELDSNVGYLQEGHALAQKYGTDFLDFMADSLLGGTAGGRRIFEVGCGGGYLLARLAAAGHDVAGIDPSPVAARVAEEAGFSMFREFYPSESFSERADLIFHYDVLEHVEDPVAFLRAHHRNLSEAGHIVIAVPDCTESISRGDISMIIHEHLNYFDGNSLAATVNAAGFNPLRVEKSRYGNVLYCLASRGAAPAAAPGAHAAGRDKFSRFASKVADARARFRKFAEPVLADARASLALYVPLRLIPYACGLDKTGFRFFDDDPGVRGKYFDGFNVPVEGFEDFLRRPPTHVVIGSFAFAEAIGRRIRENVRAPVTITTLRELAPDA